MSISSVCQSPLMKPNEYPVGKAPIETIPKDLFANVLGPMLKFEECEALSLTSKKMRGIMMVALKCTWVRKRAEITIGPDQWKSVNFEAKEVPPLPDDINAILRKDCPHFKGKKVYEKHKLILLPGELSIYKQGRLMRHLREGGNGTVFEDIWSWGTPYGDQELENPYWALVTTNVIPGSRKKTFEQQIDLIKEGYEAPYALEAIVLATMDKACSKEKLGYLLSKGPWTYTYCREHNNEGRHLAVGAFARSGLFVNFKRGKSASTGIIAVRKL